MQCLINIHFSRVFGKLPQTGKEDRFLCVWLLRIYLYIAVKDCAFFQTLILFGCLTGYCSIVLLAYARQKFFVGHSVHLGDFGVQTVAPSSINACVNCPQSFLDIPFRVERRFRFLFAYDRLVHYFQSCV